MKHPLINEDSKHYYNDDGTPSIIKMEDKLTLMKMIGFCKGNIFKYIERMNKKGQKQSDIKKIITYNKYLSYLETLYKKLSYTKSNETVHEIRKYLKEPEWEY